MAPGLHAHHRLAVYGTLAPGQPNHGVLASLDGRWIEGRVRGRLVESGWGAALGYPGLVLDEAGDVVRVWVLESVDLPTEWSRLDDFEGPGYERIEVIVDAGSADLPAYIYVASST